MKKEFANVIVDISHEKVDRPFGYRIPERLADSVTPGVRVKFRLVQEMRCAPAM